MKVSTYLRPIKDGKSRVYVKYSLNGVIKRKKTEIYYFDRPKDRAEREHNANTKLFEKTFVSKLTPDVTQRFVYKLDFLWLIVDNF